MRWRLVSVDVHCAACTVQFAVRQNLVVSRLTWRLDIAPGHSAWTWRLT
jgi:hypothetical protein